MTLLGNIIWFLLGGWALGLGYFIGAVLFFPLLPFLMPLVGYSFFPFGKTPVRRSDINAWKESRGEEVDLSAAKLTSGKLRFLSNVLWVFTFGWLLALAHFIAAFANLVGCVFLFTIPICVPHMMAHFKLMPVALRPFGVRIVPTSLAEEIRTAGYVKSL
ncbi:MAG: YccF domain-containing protein [Gemmatimonadota bacterium]|nr:YccF domain-containing protein [Gemmatimonadota bacterium]